MTNILPQEHKKKIHSDYKIRLIVLIFASASTAFLFGLILMLPAWFISTAREQVVEHSKGLLESNNASDEFRRVRSELTQVNNDIDLLKSDVRPYRIAADIFPVVIEKREDSVTIEQFFFSELKSQARIEVQGVARNRRELLEYADRLRATEMFDRVEVPVSNFVEGQALPYRISLVFADTTNNTDE